MLYQGIAAFGSLHRKTSLEVSSRRTGLYHQDDGKKEINKHLLQKFYGFSRRRNVNYETMNRIMPGDFEVILFVVNGYCNGPEERKRDRNGSPLFHLSKLLATKKTVYWFLETQTRPWVKNDKRLLFVLGTSFHDYNSLSWYWLERVRDSLFRSMTTKPSLIIGGSPS